MSVFHGLKKLSEHPFLVAIRRAFERYDQRVFYVLFGAMLLIYLLPILLSRFLPFSDLPGHLGVVGALVHQSESDANISKYYLLNPHFSPNCLEFYFTWLFGELFDVVTAARVFAMICVAALPLSVLFALRTFERNPWLVFLVFPLSYPRIMWYGFMGSALGISLMILAVAMAYRATQRKWLGYTFLLAALLVLVGMSHPFFLAATLPMVLVTLILGTLMGPRRWQNWVSLLSFVPCLMAFADWFSNTFSGLGKKGGKPNQGFVDHLLANRPEDWEVYREWLRDWSIGAYRGTLETTILKVMVWSFVVFAAVGLLYGAWRTLWSGVELYRKLATRLKRPNPPSTDSEAEPPTGEEGLAPEPIATDPRAVVPKQNESGFYRVRRGWHWQRPEGIVVAVLFACVLAAFLALPGVIHKPVYWWAVAQRLVTPVMVFAVLLIPRKIPGRYAAVLLLPALIASGYYGGFLAYDFRTHWNNKEMKGLKRAVFKIPRGQRVLALYDDRDDDHYAHYQLHFGACYYVAYRGGFSNPFPRAPGYKDIAWVYPKELPPGPPWGKITHFNYRRHARFYDYFLIKRHRDGRTRWNRFPKRCVKVIGHYGLWTVVKRLSKRRC